MKLHILSDLHTEFADFAPPETTADLVILAGDIGVGLGGLEWAARCFPAGPVIYVPGNHEYYHHDIGFTEQLRSHAPPNIHVLDKDVLEFGGVRFLGCTLWTDFRLYGGPEAADARRVAGAMMADFRLIRHGERRFTPEDSVALHEASRAWLAGQLAESFSGPTVIVTHHLPSPGSIAEKYSGDPLNPGFASRLDELIASWEPELWVHGHTHCPFDYRLSGTRVVCNPRGYPGETSGPGFDGGLIVQID